MEEKRTFSCRQIPFILNSKKEDHNPMVKEFKENGTENTIAVDTSIINIESSGELTPESQQEILGEAY